MDNMLWLFVFYLLFTYAGGLVYFFLKREHQDDDFIFYIWLAPVFTPVYILTGIENVFEYLRKKKRGAW